MKALYKIPSESELLASILLAKAEICRTQASTDKYFMDPIKNKMQAGTYNYPIESYALILNLDNSVLKLNYVLQPYGYEFVKVNLEELDKNFSHLFGLPPEFKNQNICRMSHYKGKPPTDGRSYSEVIDEWHNEQLERGVPIKEIETIISEEFHELLTYSIHNGLELLMTRELILLKKIENFDHLVINGGSTFARDFQIHNEMSIFVNDLIQKLRLFKNGDINCKTIFHISADTRRITQRFNPAFLSGGGKKYVVSDEDVELFGKLMKTNSKVNKLSELAINNFNLTYQITDLKSKYLNLMICLESLFNVNSIEITHTLSRHLAIIISDNKEEFAKNYIRIKKLYSYRSKLIHGSALNENLALITDELQDLVRRAINYCLRIDKSKDELNSYLNGKGF
jgi:hypothetical protein